MQQFAQWNEIDPLKQVIIGRYQEYNQHPQYAELVNRDQNESLPYVEELQKEFEQLRITLQKEGVEVNIPEYVGKFVYDQLTPRDIGITIGNQFLVCNMRRKSRRYEAAGIFYILDRFSSGEPNLVIPDSPTCHIEGGDVILDDHILFVARSKRTNEEGIEFLKRTFGHLFQVIVVEGRKMDEYNGILHLDCMFNILDRNLAVIYEPGFLNIPPELINQYELLHVDQAEQAALTTNVLSIGHGKVLSRDHLVCQSFNDRLRREGLEVIEVPFDAAPSTGGSIRCCTLPLVRKNLKNETEMELT